MSQFAVEVVVLDDVVPHPNADALDLAVIGGYRAVVKKGVFKKGDSVVYIPEDALVPEDILEHIGLTGRLAGKQKNRVKAIRLRGELSQGIVVSLKDFADLLTPERAKKFAEMYPNNIVFDGTTPSLDGQVGWTEILWEPGMDLAPIYDFEKWEEPIPVSMQGKATSRPNWFPVYDIENIKRYPNVFEPGEEVVFTEKLHGTNAGYGMSREDRKLLVASRKWVLEREDKPFEQQNIYWQIALSYDMEKVLNVLLDLTGADRVVVFGEIFGDGVQDLTYGHGKGKRSFRVFDILVDGEYADYWDMRDLLDDVQAETGIALEEVPILYIGPFSHDSVITHTRGTTTFGSVHMREGIVIRPLFERYHDRLGRVILKSINEDYLLRKDGTERH